MKSGSMEDMEIKGDRVWKVSLRVEHLAYLRV